MTRPTLAIDGLDVMAAADQAAIADTVTALLIGFASRDARQLDGIYTDDADWVNAFGSVKHGNQQIVGYLSGLFADQNFNAGTLVDDPHNTLKRITDEVVVVSTHLQVSGQGLLDGGAIELRDNHSLHILHRQPDGSWRIASEIFSDSRSDHSYVNHS